MTDRTELDQQIWQAYEHAYHARDTAAFLALYDPGVVRAGGPAKTASDHSALAADTAAWFAELADRGDDVAIAFRFTERIAGNGTASERGVYRLTATRADGERKVLHGRFHVFSRRVGGRWRIVADYDSDEGGTVTAEDYDAALALDDDSAWPSGRPPVE